MRGKSKYIFSFFFLLLTVVISTETIAQTRISSPYSRFGIGNLHSNKDARQMAMGGIGMTLHSSEYINFSNPASYIGFDSMSFIFQGGVYNNYVSLETNKNNQTSNYTSLAYLKFGFPVTKWWGSSFGLLPYSNVGYNISTNDYLQNIGNVNYTYEGQGGINRVYLGNAFKLIDSTLSIGVNASYLFGTLDNINTAVFVDSLYYFDIRTTNSRIVSGFLFSYGAQYQTKFKRNEAKRKKNAEFLFLESGFAFNLGSKISAKKESLTERFQLAGSGAEMIEDTVEHITSTNGNITIPLSFSGGLALRRGNNWLVGADYSWQNWADYSSFGAVDSLANSMNINIGAEYSPTHKNISKYWRKIHYRVGARYSKSYLQIQNNQIQEYAISFGVGMPVRKMSNKSVSILNIGVELGKRGTIDNNLILEKFGRVTVGVAIKEEWFLVRKYK